MYTSRIVPKLLLGVAFLLITAAAATTPAPSGSVAIETAEGSSPGDTLWTDCTVLFQGELSPCTVSGLSAPLTGLARVSGMVYGMKNVEDFAGTYKAVGDDFALGEGPSDGKKSARSPYGADSVWTTHGITGGR